MSLPTERQTLDLPDACRVLGLGETTGRKLVREGRLPIIRAGRRVLIAKATIAAILRGELDLSENIHDEHHTGEASA